MVDEDDSTTINDQAASNSSASASKIDLTFYDGIREETAEINNVNVYVYVDVGILNSILDFVGTCPTCHSKIKNELDYASRQGLARKFKMQKRMSLYNLGLGVNSMEAREQKHQRIKKYAEKATSSNPWPMIFSHDIYN